MENTSVHAGHRERIRERFRAEGLGGFAEHEVLELLLTYAIPHRDVNPLAHALLAQFGSLSGVLEAHESELMRVPGIGQRTATLITLMPALFGCYQRSALGARPVIGSLGDARAYCRTLFHGAHDELVYVICLDQGGRVLHPALLRRGTVDQVAIYPREVLETALRYHAQAVLLAHNHPSGVAEASRADYAVTRTVSQALSYIGVQLVDHLVFGDGDAFSMRRSVQGGKDGGSYLAGGARTDSAPLRAEAPQNPDGQPQDWTAALREGE